MHISKGSVASKAELEKKLAFFGRIPFSKLYKSRLEQYPTSTSIAAHMVWVGSMKNAIVDMTIADFGCGSGVLSVASLIAGARRAICVDIDEEVLLYTKKNISMVYPYISHRFLIVVGDVKDIAFENVNTVVMNPPFGVRKHLRGIDLEFLKSALKTAEFVYSLHKYSVGLLKIMEMMKEMGFFDIIWFEILDLEIPMIYQRHRRRVYRVKVLFLGLAKKGDISELCSSRRETSG